MAARPKQIEIFETKAQGWFQFRTRSTNGKVVAPHSEASHTKRWTKTLANREAEKFSPPLPVVIV